MAETTYIEAITQAMAEEMERDPSVFLIGEDVGAYGGAFKTSAGLIERFGPERVIDTPISEIAIIGAASGAALMGMRPIAEMQFIDFITCALRHAGELRRHEHATASAAPARSSCAVPRAAARTAGRSTR